MAVQAASLEVLEQAAVPPAQARAIVQAIEIEIAGAKDTLATKQDILVLRHELAELRSELRHELDEKIGGLRHELVHQLDEKLGGLRHELAGQIGGLGSEFHAAMTSNVRHMYGALAGQFALLLGVAYFFVSHLPH